jgi:NAD(P)-dependent dehydrogenase (short-subunit alcohol dehydrogenase family)
MDIQGKVVVITGASMGIGLATARQFAAAGAKVVLAARSVDRLTQLADDLKQQGREALVVPTDVTVQAEVMRLIDTAVQHYGRIDILINNAGQTELGPVTTFDVEDYRKIIDLNVFGPLFAMQAVTPKMREAGGGIIINVSSMVSKMNIPMISAYASTKAALNMLSGTARAELEPDNIRVITMYPRLTATDFGRNARGDQTMRRQREDNYFANGDSPDLVAQKILEAAQNEPAEQFIS